MEPEDIVATRSEPLGLPVKWCGEEDKHGGHEYGADDVGWFYCFGRHEAPAPLPSEEPGPEGWPSPWE